MRLRLIEGSTRAAAPRISAAGVCCLDHIFVAPQIPWGDSTHASDYLIQGGGLAATALVTCARLGARCDLFSLLGDDEVGDRIVGELEDENISTLGIIRDEGKSSPFSFVHVDEHNGERTIFHHRDPELRSTWVGTDFSVIGKSNALVIDDYFPQLALCSAREARERGIPVLADFNPRRDNKELLRFVDVLIAPRHFAALTGYDEDLDGALDAIHDYGPTTAVITLGGEGCVYSDELGHGRAGAYNVDVVDTTGAGDVFHGAFAYGLARGWETVRCADFASAVAATKCTKMGGRTGIPSLVEVLEFLGERSDLEWSGIE